MVEERVWQVENEGTLARSWEQKLKPRVEPRVRRRRALAPSTRTVGWIASMWAGAAVATFLAIHVMTMSYHYDQLNQEYAAVTRQNQSLQMSVASLTSASALQADAVRLKVAVVVPARVARKGVAPAQHAAKSATFMQQVTQWMQNLSTSLGR